MNLAMKEQAKARTPPSTRDSTTTASTTVTTSTIVSSASSQTRKRTVNRETAAIKLLQKHDCPIVMCFD
jgi:hypothetical protein